MTGKTTQYRTTEEEVILTRLLEKAIRRSEAVDREALCVVAGEKVRCVWVRNLSSFLFPSRKNDDEVSPVLLGLRLLCYTTRSCDVEKDSFPS